MWISNAYHHFITITHHRHLVRKHCFEMGLFSQGLLHDLSKYSPVEFLVGAKYYQGDRSPNNAEREATGRSLAWLHHKGRNRHHLEYWIDYTVDRNKPGFPLCGTNMPVRFVAEMFADRMAACKVYQADNYTDSNPWKYYKKGRDHYLLHDRSRRQLEFMLKMLAARGEEETFTFIRKRILRNDDKPLTRFYRYLKENGYVR